MRVQFSCAPPVPADDEASVVAVLERFRPSRLNAAGVCLWCATRWCASAECEARHAVTVWAPCGDCGGFNELTRCEWCSMGVQEFGSLDKTPAGVLAEALRAQIELLDLSSCPPADVAGSCFEDVLCRSDARTARGVAL